MIFLLFSILSSTSIFLIFKIIGRLNIPTFPVIVLNYMMAALLGFILQTDIKLDTLSNIYQYQWFWFAIVIGLLFIAGFYVIGTTAQKVGMGITSVAGKMSMIAPILLSIFYFGERSSLVQSLGILLALTAVGLTLIKAKSIKQTDQAKPEAQKYFYWPLFVFLLTGIIDAGVKFAQERYVADSLLPLFSAVLFTMAGLSGWLFHLFSRLSFGVYGNWRVYLAGILLGTCNFGSVYFLIRALNSRQFPSATIFGINHVGIVSLSVLLALIIFKEQPSRLNYLGFALSIIAIVLLTQG